MEFSSRRLDFRLLNESDRAMFIALYQDPKVMRKIGPALSAEKAEVLFESAIRNNQKAYFKQYIWRVTNKHSKSDCGLIMLKFLNHDECEIGIMLIQSQNGKGYSSEALSRVCQFAFKDLNQTEVIARFAKSHLVIKKLLTSLGFRFEEVVQNSYYDVIVARVDELKLEVI
ncbi:GNAT family N-acetyltransferase [Salinimonas sp. HHU 13199]|uniref:GNAT family N-acetyltransferase n=1 Tax=Salinimonas profundi TaxID=2729140 RepID=A0ABR8LHD4_9ALTE|nr:GNAT family N-acetyltransferase [Salinimonas profundi]MBD3585142.1 GNAT family N-acetyltransferase [Salinimonas profundi]